MAYIISGSSQSGQVHPRLEILELWGKPFQFSLFIRAFSNLQAANYRIPAASWQQIGGIHGLPYTRYSGDPGGPADPPEKRGYCFHRAVAFPTWHRVQLLLVEQAITTEASRIVNEDLPQNLSAEERQNWRTAATELRFPFWDWSAAPAANGPPGIILDRVIEVQRPGSNTQKDRFANPLASYTFNAIPAGARDIPQWGAYFGSWQRTYRWPQAVRNNPSEDLASIGRILGDQSSQQSLISLRSQLAMMFGDYPAEAPANRQARFWDYFSNAGAKPYRPFADEVGLVSIEGPHDNMHGTIGGSGHMSFNDFAGFDPIFYLHHCNVDRLYALWEYLHPDYWMNDGYYVNGTLQSFRDPRGTYGHAPRTQALTNQTDMPPFRRTAQNYWNSENVRSLEQGRGINKYYTYKPLEIRRSSGQTVTIDVSAPSTLNQRITYIASLKEFYERSPFEDDELPGAPRTQPTGLKTFERFILVGLVPQYAFQGSFRLEMYLKNIYVGEIFILSRLDTEHCDSCTTNQEDNIRVRGVIPLPMGTVLDVLDSEGVSEDSHTPDQIVDTLKKNLTSKIVAPDGTRQLAEPVSDGGEGRTTLDESKRPELLIYASRKEELLPGAPRGGGGDASAGQGVEWEAHGEVLGGTPWAISSST